MVRLRQGGSFFLGMRRTRCTRVREIMVAPAVGAVCGLFVSAFAWSVHAQCPGRTVALDAPRIAVSSARCEAFVLRQLERARPSESRSSLSGAGDAKRDSGSEHAAHQQDQDSSGQTACCTLEVSQRVSITVLDAAVVHVIQGQGRSDILIALDPGEYVANAGQRSQICPASGTASVLANGRQAFSEPVRAAAGSCLEWSSATSPHVSAPGFQVSQAFRAGIPGPPPASSPDHWIDFGSLLSQLRTRDDTAGLTDEGSTAEVSGGATCLDTGSGSEGSALPEPGSNPVEVAPRPGVLHVEVELIRR